MNSQMLHSARRVQVTLTVTLVSCPFFSRAVWPYFKAYIQNDMSQPLLMRCGGLLVDGKQLLAVAVLLFGCIASIYCQSIYMHSEWHSVDGRWEMMEKWPEMVRLSKRHLCMSPDFVNNGLMQVFVIRAFNFLCVHPWRATITFQNCNKTLNADISRKGNKN